MEQQQRRACVEAGVLVPSAASPPRRRRRRRARSLPLENGCDVGPSRPLRYLHRYRLWRLWQRATVPTRARARQQQQKQMIGQMMTRGTLSTFRTSRIQRPMPLFSSTRRTASFRPDPPPPPPTSTAIRPPLATKTTAPELPLFPKRSKTGPGGGRVASRRRCGVAGRRRRARKVEIGRLDEMANNDKRCRILLLLLLLHPPRTVGESSSSGRWTLRG